MLLLLSLVWGGSFFFNRVALDGLPVLTVVASRVTLAALVLAAVLRVTSQRIPREGRVLRAFLVMGAFNNALPFALIVWGQSHIASGVASILNASTPFWTVIFAHLLTQDEKLTPLKFGGVLVGLSGVAVMIGGGAVAGFGTHVTAMLACLSAAICYALAGIYGKRFAAMKVPPMVTATGQITASALILAPLALVMDRPWTLPVPSLAVVSAVLGVAVLSTALAYVLYFRILSTAGATNIALVTFLVPVSAILLGTLILNEVLLPRHLGGMALIALGLSGIDGRLWRRWRPT
ncbi:DMT family transporter [Sagittula salina]|nr:DMT family transporter [Sagittula salina]